MFLEQQNQENEGSFDTENWSNDCFIFAMDRNKLNF